MQEAMNYIRNKDYAVGILLDMSKAYDRVLHHVLLSKIYCLGIRGNAYNWVKSYLTGREQCVQIEFINQAASEIQQIQSNMVMDHNLEINSDKTKIIQFRPYQRQPISLEATTARLKIEEVHSCTLLGVTIDTYVCWKDHIDRIKSKLSQFIYALSVLKSNTNIECALSAYYAYAFAWLSYGVVLWGYRSEANDLFILQKKCMRIIYNMRQLESCRPIFNKNNILTFPCIYILGMAKFVRKHLHLFQFTKSARRRHILELPAPKLQMFKTSPYYRSINIYNKLPNSIKEVETEIAFNKEVAAGETADGQLVLNILLKVGQEFRSNVDVHQSTP
ncbi:reverse transcriptase (RNA-dependent DNA polymerase) domain-containing protein [Phthorimaea operculella]|nr:reverse transcriptase (RNA-dependent DNA polymerase) domain-containing protein [Phthorimaea operculella]